MKAAARLLAASLLVLAAGACDGKAGPAAGVSQPPAGVGCAGLLAPPTGAAPAAGTPTASPTGGATAVALPALVLPCLGGGDDVDLSRLRGPAVVNLWASWCAPCREELPVLQRFAERGAGLVHVVGVVTADDRAVAAELAAEFGLTYPHLDDRAGAVRVATRAAGMPATLFVDGAGRVRGTYAAGALDAATLDALARRHLGVTLR